MAEIDWNAVKERKTLLYIGKEPIDVEFLNEGTKAGDFEYRFQVLHEGVERTLVTKSGRFLTKLADYVPLTGSKLRLSKKQENFALKSIFTIERVDSDTAKKELNSKFGKKAKK